MSNMRLRSATWNISRGTARVATSERSGDTAASSRYVVGRNDSTCLPLSMSKAATSEFLRNTTMYFPPQQKRGGGERMGRAKSKAFLKVKSAGSSHPHFSAPTTQILSSA